MRRGCLVPLASLGLHVGAVADGQMEDRQTEEEEEKRERKR